MDYLWSPWRYQYVTNADKSTSCIFCDLPARGNDRAALIVHRGQYNYIVLNAFPYTSGHSMVVPYVHADRLDKLGSETAAEMMQLTVRLESVLFNLYHPDGLNLGMNVGKAAGAGVAGHLHMHALPRWIADANFMTTVGETRVLPEDLATTYERLSSKFGNEL